MRASRASRSKLIGTGEKTDAMEDFIRAHRRRILGMARRGRCRWWKRPAANIDAEKAARVAEKMRKVCSTSPTLREQLLQHGQHGRYLRLMVMMPGIAKMKNQIANAGIDDKVIQAPGRGDRFDDAGRNARTRTS